MSEISEDRGKEKEAPPLATTISRKGSDMSGEHPENGVDVDQAQKPADGKGGEDESSTERYGDNSHLHKDQKAPSFPAAEPEKDVGGI